MKEKQTKVHLRPAATVLTCRHLSYQDFLCLLSVQQHLRSVTTEQFQSLPLSPLTFDRAGAHLLSRHLLSPLLLLDPDFQVVLQDLCLHKQKQMRKSGVLVFILQNRNMEKQSQQKMWPKQKWREEEKPSNFTARK